MKVNDGATLCLWSDRHAGTIIEVSENGKTLKWQRDFSVRADHNGMSDQQSYTYVRNDSSPVLIFTLRKDGHWYQKGQKMGTAVLSVGHRSEYYDFSF